MRIRRLSKLIALFVSLAISTTAHARDIRVGDIFAGYSLLHGDTQTHGNGWEISVGGHFFNFNQWLSLHADFDAHHQSSASSGQNQHDFLLGPQFSHRINHFTLFAHTFAGAAHVSGNLGKETGFSMVNGGGVDYDINPVVGIRVAQVDYQATHVFGSFQNNSRFSFGIVFRMIGFADGPPPPPPEPKSPSSRQSQEFRSIH